MKKPFYFQIAVKKFERKDVAGTDGGAAKKILHVEGMCSTPTVDRYNDIVEPGAFAKSLPTFLKSGSILRSHDQDEPVGTPTDATVTDAGLMIGADIYDEETINDIEQGGMKAFSIGYIAKDWVLQHDDGSPYNFETDVPWDSDLVRVIKELDLVEVSIVSCPAQPEALFSIAKSVKSFFAGVGFKSAMKRSLETKSFSPFTLDEATRPGETKDAGEATETAPAAEAAPAADAPAPAADAPAPEAAPAAADAPKEEPAPVADAPAPADDKKPDDAAADAGAGTKPPEDKTDVAAAADAGTQGTEKAGETPAPAAPETAPAADPAKPDADKAAPPVTRPKVAVSDEIKSAVDKVCEALQMTSAVETVSEKSAPTGAEKLPEAVKTFIAELVTLVVTENKRAEDLTAKLKTTPVKTPLAAIAQFGAAPETAAAETDDKPKAKRTTLFKNIVDRAKRD